MSKFVPSVNEADVERLLNRDYPSETHDELTQLFASVTVGERLRVIVACLKNGDGEPGRLEAQLSSANGYWRETISEAEYPKIEKGARLTKDEIHEKQKRQYLEWFNR